MYKKAVKDGMTGIALTDHGNMFGVFEFVAEASKYNIGGKTVIKPIVGCEFYMVENRHKRSFTKEDKDVRRHQLFLAKNTVGYHNLVKMCSLGYIEGLYGKYPRIDKELVLKYHEGLIATTCCLGAEVPQTILRKGEEEGEKVFKWWLDIFGDDYYVELQRHDIPDQNTVNEVLLRFAKKYNVQVIASNDSHYTDRDDYNAHDILLCINTGEKQSTPAFKEFADDDVQLKNTRFAFANDQFYFKTQAEMLETFKDIPHAVDNTQQIVDKIEVLNLKKDIALPNYQIPDGFTSQDDYLEYLTYEGAKKRYVDLTAEVDDRLRFELGTIRSMGFAGYFLIVQDFINHGKDIGVFIGPGRGSAAGSVVAYCIGITNIDPIKYKLLFERFLNPDRKSMPDIDTDFDDEGRQKVIDYVVQKYGRSQVAQIVTYGTMAAKSSIKDVARVLDLPLQDANMLAKLVPDKPGVSLNRVLTAPLDGKDSLKEKEELRSEDIDNVKKLREKMNGNTMEAQVLREALKLEGTARNTGIHAAGIIIAPTDLTDIIPVCTSKETELYITQYEGNVIESAGVIKMDFLGLKNLTIIRDALRLIKQNYGLEIDIDNIPLDDPKTFALFQKGETNGVFQFESPGMQKHMRDLKPDQFGDLIAMNALYRPGPIAYIPNYIARKHGREEIIYDLPEMEEYLDETYGVTVYQEQVMLLSQKLAGFTKGDADVLRKAMGKKDRATLDKMKSKFMDGAKAKNMDEKKLEKIWTDWEAFAQYAFNKSHSTCYAFVAYQTMYLKANYASEYMASVLSNNMGNIDKISFGMEECKRMGLNVKGPDVNESSVKFAVNKQGEVRYALSAIKGVGEAAVEAILEEREKAGPFTSIFDMTRRVNLRSVNKKSLESLAQAGAFDCFSGITRSMYLLPDEKFGRTATDMAVEYGNKVQTSKDMMQNSLFGGTSDEQVAEPVLTKREEYPLLEKLKKEKEVTGIYISGHPVDDYRLELKHFTNTSVSKLDEVKDKDREIKIAGIISSTITKISKNGNAYGEFTLEDLEGFYTFRLFGKDFLEYRKYVELESALVHITGRMQQSYRNPEELEFKINKIDLLSDIRQKLTKSLTLKIQQEMISENTIKELESILDEFKGELPVKFKIEDAEDKIAVQLYSTKYKVELSNDLISKLTQYPEFEYGLN